ncbi:hypothetical protein LDO26_01260 [Luteimonas sp. BDR2-5]|uniref:hypothetical protein n=1 Tax=Proluteimonas luteida TaxID=2878685 RepID=UPI001E5692BA|nr:hypothetical protein [Luteimonas sp. BDR2-5]MCD9026845.1 hypothetical protein [Luteimonas sp. BDR2-5]
MEELQIRGRVRVLGPLLLALGILLACGAVLAARQTLDRRSAVLAEHISATEEDRRLAAAAVRSDTAEPLTEAALLQLSRQVGMINRDWSDLLESLVPQTDDVRLLSVDVDPFAGAVRLSGVGDSAERANAYSALLEERAVVGDVRLQSLEPSGARMAFEVTARWTD